jgi:phage recombination protein Bet
MTMTTALATVEHGSALAARDDSEMRQEQVALLRKTIANDAPPLEFDLFVATCNRLRLDPFARQIYLVPRFQDGKKVWQSQVSIDGFRLIAERTGQYRGQTPVEWCGKDGRWVDVWTSSELPVAARVGVIRAGFAAPLVRVARFASYAQTTRDGNLNKIWRTMPDVMVAKCAEALALRAAFPYELSGVYTTEEMPVEVEVIDQATGEVTKAPQQKTREAQTGLVDGAVQVSGGQHLDVYGIAIPLSACPVVPAGKQNAGKRWDELPRWLLEKMQLDHRDRMSAVQRDWIDYLVAHHTARKQREAAALAEAAAAGFVPESGEAAPHAESGCGADPADGDAAQ